MSAEGLKKAVLDAARGEADQIVAQARSSAETVRKQALEQAERTAASQLEHTRQQSAQESQQAMAERERGIRLETLSAKNQLLEQAFKRAAEAFHALPLDQLKNQYRGELAALDLQDAVVHVPHRAKAEFESLVGGRCQVAEDPSLDAGFVVAHRDFRLDRSLAARLEELRTELRTQVAELLFGTKK